MSEPALIDARNVSRYYGGRCAVNDISFTIKKGETAGFLGPNGAGKSTLMQILCGVLAASAGSVAIAGYDMLEQPSRAKRRLGYLPEQPPIYPDCSVDEYLRYSASLRGVPRREIMECVDNSKQKCGLAGTGNRLIGNLSKGYQQRVGIAQAIIHSPEVIVLDEPTTGLDPNQMIEIRELIRDMGSDHAIILSTHIMAEAQTICDRILIMHEGRVVLDRGVSTLHEGGETQSILVAFNVPPADLTDLSGLEGVNSVTALGANRFRVHCRRDPAMAAAIAATAAARQWGLCELVTEMNTLEQIYLRLTRGNTSANTPAQA
jgi:ABC-2 type transport system ATP-binding protein